MVGILDEADIYKCRKVIPSDQSFVTGFSLLLLSNSNTISHANSKIRTYSSRPIALLLSNQQIFLVSRVQSDSSTTSSTKDNNKKQTSSSSSSSSSKQQEDEIELIGSCNLSEISKIQTGYLHSSGSHKKKKQIPTLTNPLSSSPTSASLSSTDFTTSQDDILLSDNRTSPGQYSLKISRHSQPSWTMMTFSPSDTPQIQKERVSTIASSIKSLVRESIIQSQLQSQLSSEEKLFIPLVYYQPNDKYFVEGELHLNLQKISFIQKYVRDGNLKHLSKVHDNFSFSVDTISIYECKQIPNSKAFKKFSQVNILSQGKEPSELISFYFPMDEVPQITNSIIRLITESQDIADQVYKESSNKNNDSTSTTTTTTTPNRGTGQKSLTDSDFYLVDEEDEFGSGDSSNGSTGNLERIVEDDYGLTSQALTTTLENNTPTHKPTKNNFKTSSDILSSDDILWLQSFLPLRHNDDVFEMIYSTNKHGISIKTFFSRLYNRSPCIMAIKDDRGQVFGAYTADPWNTEKKIHYGSGETFLFKINDHANRNKFSWTRKNDDFMLSTKEAFVSMGSGGKGVGLWIDEDLFYGSSNRCATFDNEPLASTTDFKIMELEVWSPLKSKNATSAPKMQNATDLFGTRFTYKPPPKTIGSYY
ncbi:TLDc domain-containing protein [Cavenderia fasciculata]|uniref:TLDc domain-containing protein n=1 Tax=Cavenderia fasciculata TaxID=261658 RepID=F4Q5E9_CACFS|nr:TLDc domain-containing protein [Cavenderia fasciculata]EGG17208.1 TLDc domain-containing protein [Cavenderia fasciculata]|eukprot:XP_004355692.1 TLDc domain-containing protein [Cavenderia fasciculata]